MNKPSNVMTLAVFEGRHIRRQWDDAKEKWYFAIIDVVEVLTESTIPKRYWSDLKRKLADEGSQVYEKIVRLKFPASDGKKYLSDAADTETMFRIIQSIPSPNAEPFKLWLARVGYERIEHRDLEFSVVGHPFQSTAFPRSNHQHAGYKRGKP